MIYNEIDKLMEKIYERFDMSIYTGGVFGDAYLQLTDIFSFQTSTLWEKNTNKKGCYVLKDGNIFTTRKNPDETDMKVHFVTEYNVYLLMQDDDGKDILMETEDNPIKVCSEVQYKLCDIEELEKIFKEQNIEFLKERRFEKTDKGALNR